MKRVKFILICVLVFGSFAPANPVVTGANSEAFPYLDKFYRTELYFGFGKKDGTEVSDAEWEIFLTKEVSPRFPDGFTVLYAMGQFRSGSGKIVREKSRVLVLFYPKRTRSATVSKIEAIRGAYVKLFSQESVLRVDLQQSVNVFF